MPEAQQETQPAVQPDYTFDIESGVSGFDINEADDQDNRRYQELPMSVFVELSKDGIITDEHGYFDIYMQLKNSEEYAPYPRPFLPSEAVNEEGKRLFDAETIEARDDLNDEQRAYYLGFAAKARIRFFFGTYTHDDILEMYPEFVLKMLIGGMAN